MKRFFLSLLCWLALAGTGLSAVAFDAASSAPDNLSSATLTWNHVNAGDALFVGCAIRSDSVTMSTVKWDTAGANQSFTFKARLQNVGSFRDIEIWYLVAPATGTKTIEVTMSAGSINFACGAISVTGAVQSGDPLGTAASSQADTGTSSSISVSSGGTDELVVDFMFVLTTAVSPGVTGSGQVERFSEDEGTSVHFLGSTMPGAIGTVVPAWSWTNSVEHSQIGASVIAAAAAGSAVTAITRRRRY